MNQDEEMNEVAGAKIDAMGLQENDDCNEEEEVDEYDYLYCDPEFVKKDEPGNKPQVFCRIEVPLSDELRRLTETLDEFQKEVVNIVVTYAKDLVKARKLGNPLPTPPLLMVNGAAIVVTGERTKGAVHGYPSVASAARKVQRVNARTREDEFEADGHET